ncbi:MAG: ribosomal subunit interface protein, partial [Gordonia sp. (in: high G+C Gram-positive bacteria)]
MTVVHRKGQREPKGPAPDNDVITTAFERPANLAEVAEPAQPEADVTMSGRNVVIPEHFRVYMGDKLSRLERFDSSIDRFEVVIYHEPNPRQ